ncbi:MAG: hypothetical protein KJ646_05850 [Nanoarchaeota archaeon]|nr:hypothetical protein [Nanoarchaeota archaeon]MBU4116390.1 hypothetical protein [Nanoarchaeota archaeon]
MEVQTTAKKIGGSIGIIIPKIVIKTERISAEDTIKLKIEKVDSLEFLWGMNKDIKKLTNKIMKEIDEGEDD